MLGRVLLGAILAAFIGGCSSDAINPHLHNTFLDANDLITMTDQMAASLVQSPAIERIAARGPLVVVLTPLKNATNSIITRGQGAAFLHRLRLLLAGHTALAPKFVFVVTRRQLSSIQAQSLANPAMPGRLTPQYALQATFYADTNIAPEFRSDYYLCTFFLTNIRSGQIIWQGSYETRKIAHSSFLY
jgi:PBP1b-binding outer membrane lipoprotein LpoB